MRSVCNMKTINVVAAVIRKDNMVFATQRGYGEFKNGWKFPGGKVEVNATPEEEIVREIHEELETKIIVDEYLHTIEYDYPAFHLSMKCYLCHVAEGDLVLMEHEAAKWLTKDTLASVEWLPADQKLIPLIEKKLNLQ